MFFQKISQLHPSPKKTPSTIRTCGPESRSLVSVIEINYSQAQVNTKSLPMTTRLLMNQICYKKPRYFLHKLSNEVSNPKEQIQLPQLRQIEAGVQVGKGAGQSAPAQPSVINLSILQFKGNAQLLEFQSNRLRLTICKAELLCIKINLNSFSNQTNKEIQCRRPIKLHLKCLPEPPQSFQLLTLSKYSKESTRSSKSYKRCQSEKAIFRFRSCPKVVGKPSLNKFTATCETNSLNFSRTNLCLKQMVSQTLI